MTSENEYGLGRRAFHRTQEESLSFILVLVALTVIAAGSYILVARFHLHSSQLVEGALYALLVLVGSASLTWYLLTLRRRRATNWPHPPLYIGQDKRPEGRQGRE